MSAILSKGIEMMRQLGRCVAALALVGALTGCGPASSSGTTAATALPTAALAAQPFALTSGVFEANGLIPARYTCKGDNLSPALAWSAPPAGTQSFALVMDDPDAVKVAGHIWDHWLLFNLPASARALAEGVPAQDELPDGGRHGQNSFGKLNYGGPCPPSGPAHTYRFVLYAVDRALDLKPGVVKSDLLKALEGHILAQAELDGRYAAP